MRAKNRTCGPTEPTCVLCFYPARSYVIHPVPLAQPPAEHIICLDCAEEIRDLLQDRPDVEPESDE